MSSAWGLVIISSPTSSGSPVTTENISGGSPASYMTSARMRAVSGVSSVGFSTMQLPVATEGATLWAGMLSGWLKGVMAEIAVKGSRGGEDAPRLALGRDVAGEGLAVVQDRQLPGQGEDVIGPAHLVEGVLLADAAFGGDQIGDFLAPVVQDLGRPHQDLLALVAGEARLVVGGDLKGLAHLRLAGPRRRAHHRAGIGVQNLEDRLALDLLAGDAHGLVTRAVAVGGGAGDGVHDAFLSSLAAGARLFKATEKMS